MTELEIRLERLRSPEILERIEDGWRTVLFACGAVEQHGPHLPLFTDTESGSRLAVEVARSLVDEFRGAVWLVDLRDLDDAEGITEAVRAVLGLPWTHAL